MKITTLILGLITLTSCNGVSQTNKIDLKIPDKVEVIKSQKHSLLLGTRLYITIPDGFHLRDNLLRVEKDSDPNTYIRFIESPQTDFLAQKHLVKERLEEIKKKGFNVQYEKDFKIGENEAILVFGSPNPAMGGLSLNYGNTKYSVTIAAQFPASEINDRDKILSSILASYVDEKIIADPTALATFSLDVANSDFKFNSSMSQLFYYTINGTGNPVNNPFENQIMVVTMPAFENFEARKTYARSMIQRYKNSGIRISTYEDKA